MYIDHRGSGSCYAAYGAGNTAVCAEKRVPNSGLASCLMATAIGASLLSQSCSRADVSGTRDTASRANQPCASSKASAAESIKATPSAPGTIGVPRRDANSVSQWKTERTGNGRTNETLRPTIRVARQQAPEESSSGEAGHDDDDPRGRDWPWGKRVEGRAISIAVERGSYNKTRKAVFAVGERIGLAFWLKTLAPRAVYRPYFVHRRRAWTTWLFVARRTARRHRYPNNCQRQGNPQ